MQLQLSYVNEILIFVIFAVSLNLLMGYTGQVSVAHAAFGALGGYSVAYLALNQHLPLLALLAIATVLAFVVGLLVGLPALRLKTEWLILLTLAVQAIIVALATTSTAFGGTYGLQNVTGLSLLGWHLNRASDLTPLALVLAAVVFALCWRMGESPYGRVLRGIREDEVATRSLGKNVFGYKLSVFGITSGMAGLAGALLVLQNTIASPALFSFDQSVEIIAMVILGGMGNLVGSVLGAAIIVLTTPFFENVVRLSATTASLWRLIAYGLLLVVIMLVRSQGLLPEGSRLSRSLWGRVRGISGGRGQLALALSRVTAASGTVTGPSTVTRRSNFKGMAAPRAPLDLAPARLSSPKGGIGAVPPLAPVQPEPGASSRVMDGRGDDECRVMVEVRGLSKRFGGIVATEDLDMDLRAGTITALVGPNGAGKTTVFNLLTGAIRPDRGMVRLKGRDVTGMTPDEVARLGMVRSFQDVRVFPRLSVLANVMLAVQGQPGERLGPLFASPLRTARVESATRQEALRWLDFVGMADLGPSPVGDLGFGQQKLVALARVLASGAEVLLLDEPASGIDQQWVDVMLGLVEQLRDQGRTVCIVEHNLHVVGRLADRVYFMELGRITAQGSFEELTGEQRLAEAYFGTA